MNRVKSYYNETVKAALVKKFEYTSIMQAPRLMKIVVNIGDRKSVV